MPLSNTGQHYKLQLFCQLWASGNQNAKCRSHLWSLQYLRENKESILFSVKSIILKAVITLALLISKLQSLAKENAAKQYYKALWFQTKSRAFNMTFKKHLYTSPHRVRTETLSHTQAHTFLCYPGAWIHVLQRDFNNQE